MKKVIQGFLFQKSSDFTDDQRHSLMISSTSALQMKDGLCRIMFSGIFSTEPPELLNEFDEPGYMIDRLGVSVLQNIHFTPDGLYFEKMYAKTFDSSVYETIRNSGKILFYLERKDDLWVGEFKCSKGWSGSVSCIIVDAPDRLFLPGE
jgi:hypothetical protein